MTDYIEKYRDAVVQIATPYSTGTGFYLKSYDLIITNEHVVRGNREAVIDGKLFEKQITTVLYVDQRFDLAFLGAPSNKDALPDLPLDASLKIKEGEAVIAVGHPFGLKYTATKGIISNTRHSQNELNYLQHDAALNPGNSGGPLINDEGYVIGVNTFIIRDGNNIFFSLPINYLTETISEFKKGDGQIGVRCYSCSNLVFESTIDSGYCPHCGSKLELPSEAEKYEPVGLKKTIEDLLGKLNYKVDLSRRGPNNWEVIQGSAKINISYYEKTGMIIGDAHLCLLPKDNIQAIYEFLLKENFNMDGLTFSVKGQDIILSL
ncbi:MAG: trypsin-like peptidase domain-containing protein, partial [Bacteroidota bacterium]